jgi:hypothetical protein
VRAWQVAAESQARHVEQTFERELGAMYQDPAAARTAFDLLAAEQGAERAAATLRERPEALGPLRTAVGQDSDRVGELVAQAAARGVEKIQARAAAGAGHVTGREARAELGGALRAEVARAAARKGAILAEFSALPSQTELERRISYAVGRLLPREVRLLKTALTAPQLAIAVKLGRALRDVALGRDEERDQAR